MPTPEQMAAVVHAYVDGFERGDADALAALFASDATVEDPVGTPARTGPEAIRAFYGEAVAMGAKLHLDGPIRIGPDYAAFPFHVALAWKGQSTRIDVIDVFRFDAAGKIRSMQAFFGPGNSSAMPSGA